MDRLINLKNELEKLEENYERLVDSGTCDWDDEESYVKKRNKLEKQIKKLEDNL